MIEAVSRWTARGLSLLVLGPLAARAAATVRGADGSDAATLLTGASVPGGLLVLLVVGVCVLAAGGIAARLADRHEAILNMGFVLGWVAWTGGSMTDVLRLSPEASTLIRLAFEGLLLGGLVVGGCVLADRLSRRGPDAEGLDLSKAGIRASLTAKGGWATLGVSTVAALACAFLFARYGGAGQGVGAAFLGGFLAGLLGSQTQQSLSKNDRDALKGATAVMIPVILGVLLAAVIGPLVGMGKPGASRLLESIARGSLPGWVLITPAGWCCGALIGVPMGAAMMRPSARDEAEGTVTGMLTKPG